MEWPNLCIIALPTTVTHFHRIPFLCCATVTSCFHIFLQTSPSNFLFTAAYLTLYFLAIAKRLPAKKPL